MIWLILVSILVGAIYWKFFRILSYWKDRNVLHKKPWPFVGNSAKAAFGRRSFADTVKDFYFEFPRERYNGAFLFTEPTLVLRDLDLIKQITVKDFDHFINRRQNFEENVDSVISKTLLFLKGQKWRKMRATLSPVFTSSKLRGMFNLMTDCAEELTDYYLKQGKKTITVNMKDTMTRFTNDVIASTAFGFKCNSQKDRSNEFYLMGKQLTEFRGLARLRFVIMNIYPKLLSSLNISIFPKKMITFFKTVVKRNMMIREKENIVRPDVINLLMEARKGRLKHDERIDSDFGFATVQESEYGKSKAGMDLTDEDITAQALVFFSAGFETVSTLLCFASYELATHPDCQMKLQKEIDDALAKDGGKLGYEEILNLKYLDMVVCECLRKYPSVIMADRRAVSDYVIQSTENEDKPLRLDKGTVVLIPIIGIHYDPKYFPNPERFDPERFSDENKHNIIPYSYIPFGIGPRNCIGSRFALLETKILLVQLLSKFNIEVTEKTPVPARLDKKSVNLAIEGGFWLGLKAR